MFDVFDEDLIEDIDDDEEFLTSSLILEANSQLTVPKRSLNNVGENSNGEKGSKRARVSNTEVHSKTNIAHGITDLLNARQRVERKFAGPAGKLPNLEFDKLKATSDSLNKAPSFIYFQDKNSDLCFEPVPSQNLLTQQQTEWFNKPPWTTVQQDINSITDENREILEKFTIAWVLKQVKRNVNFTANVFPFLCVILISITNEEGDSHNAIFQDLSGKIHGSIHQKVIKNYRSRIKPGCLLVLHQFGIFSPSPKKHYLCITENNVARIYNANDEGDVACDLINGLSWNQLALEAVKNIVECGKEKQSNDHNEMSINNSCILNGPRVTTKAYQEKNNSPALGQQDTLTRVRQSSSNKLSVFVSHLESPISSQSSSGTKKFTFKKLTQEARVTVNSESTKTNSTTLDLNTEFADEMWNDDDFESIVKDIQI